MNLSGVRRVLPSVMNVWWCSLSRNSCAVLTPFSAPSQSKTCAFGSAPQLVWSRKASKTTGASSAQLQTQFGDDMSSDVALSENDIVVPRFENRNPRNLEQMGLARKRQGWKFQYPSKEYYHRLLYDRTHRATHAWVEHSNGKVVVSASTGELAIAGYLYSSTDKAASLNIGRVLAQRCQECGITSMVLQAPESGVESSKFVAFCEAMEAGGIKLEEKEVVEPEYVPGIDYNNEEELTELKTRQARVTNLGHWSKVHRRMQAIARGRKPNMRKRYEKINDPIINKIGDFKR